jgi:formate hydrogenlyase subunit 6/NADH:ubiquinone oxidoreductase subunit I
MSKLTTKIPEFDYAICMACNICADLCPLTCIEMSKPADNGLRKIYPTLVSLKPVQVVRSAKMLALLKR